MTATKLHRVIRGLNMAGFAATEMTDIKELQTARNHTYQLLHDIDGFIREELDKK